MENFCGYLQAGLRLKRYSWANLNNHVLKLVYLGQVRARYDVEDELSTRKRDKSSLSISEHIYDDCESSSLLTILFIWLAS